MEARQVRLASVPAAAARDLGQCPHRLPRVMGTGEGQRIRVSPSLLPFAVSSPEAPLPWGDLTQPKPKVVAAPLLFPGGEGCQSER